MRRLFDSMSTTQLGKVVDEKWNDNGSDSEPPLLPGTRIGEYRVVQEIGRGAMGVVFLAVDEQLQRKVAIKLIHERLMSDTLRERFKQEARAMALVNHPNVLSIYAFGEHDSTPYFAMEFVEGQTVEQWLDCQPLPDIDVALSILGDICDGVSAIHAAGAVHRDIKPGNVLLDSTLRARVADFGLAMPLRDKLTPREVAGTPAYMAPEIGLNGAYSGAPTPKSDVYALGCVAFELLTGRLPFDSENEIGMMVQHMSSPVPKPSSLRPDLPPVFDQVLLQALAKRPEDRIASADLFRRCLFEARQKSIEPVRILVAEDDDDFRELLAIKLSREFPDAEIECVGDGASLLESFDRKAASAVIVDLQMPALDGFGVTALLRSRPSAANVPIIVLTAAGGPQEWTRLSALGADRFMVKPVNLEDVVTVTRRAVRERSSTIPPMV